MSGLKAHWDKVYSERGAEGVSWYQAGPKLSLELIRAAALAPGARVLDMGGGASTLADDLLGLGLSVDVADLSQAALDIVAARLQPLPAGLRLLQADATAWIPDSAAYDLWHDRAVFHFLTEPGQRAAYVQRLRQGLKPSGILVLAAFAPDGPEKCSNLPVCRYDAAGLLAELGAGFQLLEERDEAHRTPWDTQQKFRYYRLKKEN